MRIRSILCVVGTAFVLSSAAGAQQATSVDSAAVAATHRIVESSMDRPSAVVRRSVVTTPLAAPAAATAGLGRAKAMMIVGGAGMVAGALIGDDTGQIIMVGGAIVGLYGLWLYLQ
jgi:hypothetical protein